MAAEGFSWDELRLVLAIARTGSLGAAAEALAVNGSTVFRRLRQLEDRLGLKLFERHRSGYVATGPGADMAELGRRMDVEVAGLSRRLAGTASDPAGEIRLTTNDTLLANMLVPLLAGFRARHPAITLDVVLSNDALNLSRRDADVALRATDRPPETLVGRRLGRIGWALYGRRDAGWSAASSDADLGAGEWVGLGDPLGGLAAARVPYRYAAAPRIVCKVNSVLPLIDMVEGGIGIGALPCFTADRRPALARIRPPDPDLGVSLWLLTHPDLRHAPRIRAFVDHLAAAIGARRAVLSGEAAPDSP